MGTQEYEYLMVQVTKTKASSVKKILQSRSLETYVVSLPTPGTKTEEATNLPGVEIKDVWRASQSVRQVFEKIRNAHRAMPVRIVRSTSSDSLPRIRTFTLWVEGYRASSENGTAQYLGAYTGVSLADAAQAWYRSQKDAKRQWGALYVSDSGRPSVWGCRIFEAEEEARASFG